MTENISLDIVATNDENEVMFVLWGVTLQNIHQKCSFAMSEHYDTEVQTPNNLLTEEEMLNIQYGKTIGKMLDVDGVPEKIKLTRVFTY